MFKILIYVVTVKYIGSLIKCKRGYMKKLVLTVLLLSFISVVPSFGMKLITNTPMDRTVPSRCSGQGSEYTVESTYVQTPSQTTPGYSTGYRDGWGYQGVTYERYYKPLLGVGIRPELVGTTWNYPSYKEYPAQTTQAVTKTYNNVFKNSFDKRYIREAADYYVVDTITHPNNAIMVNSLDERL